MVLSSGDAQPPIINYEFRIMNCLCGVVEWDARPPIIEFRIMYCLCGVVERGRSTSYWELWLGAKKSYDIVVQYHNSVVFVRKSG